MNYWPEPPTDVPRFIPTVNFEDRTPATTVPRAHTEQDCPHYKKSKEVKTIEPGDETPTVTIPNRTSNVVSTKEITVPWCQYCQNHHE